MAVIAVFESLVKDDSYKDSGDLTFPVDFYMKQTGKLDYACGIIACIHSILNNRKNVQITEGSVIDKYFKSCEGKSPEERAKLLENNEEFKVTHASFASQGQSA